MTQTMLADRIGVSKSMISSYESNGRQPSYESLYKLAKFFNISMDYLFGFEKRPGGRYVDTTGLNEKQNKVIFELVAMLKMANGNPDDYDEML